MRNLKILSAICLGLFITVLVINSSLPLAAELGSTWQRPLVLDLGSQPFVHYGKLGSTGEAIYFRLPISQPVSPTFQIDIPSNVSPKFAPQLVVFEPYSSTIGPLLPLAQPPKTIALVYPMTTVKEVFDPMTQAAYRIRLEAKPELTTPGTYLIAVYNAGSVGGSYRMMMGDNLSMAKWPDVWMIPMNWWSSQMFVGFSWMTLIFPTILGLLIWLIYLRLDHHQLHVHKKYPTRVTKKAKK